VGTIASVSSSVQPLATGRYTQSDIRSGQICAQLREPTFIHLHPTVLAFKNEVGTERLVLKGLFLSVLRVLGRKHALDSNQNHIHVTITAHRKSLNACMKLNAA
jgi:hypothetical protein